MKSNDTPKSVLPMIASVVLSLVIGIGAGIMGWRYYKNQQRSHENPISSDAEEEAQQIGESIVYDGKRYKYNTELVNVLFMGVDMHEAVPYESMPGTAGQADCIMIVSMNKTDKTAKIIQISRDSMTSVDVYDIAGNYYTSVNMQIAAQYAYGNGGQNSLWSMKKTVSELMYDIPIDGCISMTIDGIASLNDAIGGVTLTIPEDYTAIDPEFVQESTLTLTGEQAEKYVRSRDVNLQGSNSQRMQRQVQYVTALLGQVKDKLGGNLNLYEKFFPLVESDVVTDMAADQLNDMASYTYLTDEIEYVPGEVVAGEEHEEFYVDEEKLQELIIKVFYKEI